MFGNIGTGEIIIIFGLALVIIGPEKFPEFAKIVMRTIRDLRGYVDDLKRDIAREIRPVDDELSQLSRYNPEEYIDALAGPSEEAESETKEAGTAAQAEQNAPAVDARQSSEQPYEEPPQHL
jgi:Tat protein translocase TatB subunit